MQIGVSVKSKNRMANNVNPDETALDEPSDLDLHCLHRYLFWSARLKGLCTSLRDEALLMSIHNICFHGEIRKTSELLG